MKDILDASDLDRLDGFLARVDGGAIPNVEALDGMFAALACCPDIVRPSEFLPVIERGGREGGDLVLADLDELEQFIGLVVGHWNRVNRLLASQGTYAPSLLRDEDGEARGSDWARGFLTGMKLRRDIWCELTAREELNALLVPITLLAYEDHPDPELRPFTPGLDEAQRADLLSRAAEVVMKLHGRLVRGQEGATPEMERLH